MVCAGPTMGDVIGGVWQGKFYTSPDLKNWTESGEFGLPGDDRLRECPDLVRLKVEGTRNTSGCSSPASKKAPTGRHRDFIFMGDFDARPSKDIKNQNGPITAPTTMPWWPGAATPGTRTSRWAGWDNWLYAQMPPTTRWRSTMTIPRELSLIKRKAMTTPWCQSPAVELKSLEKVR